MPEPEGIKTPSKQGDASAKLRDDVSSILQKLAHHEVAFSRFAARQELLLTKVIEAVDAHSPTHMAVVSAASSEAQTPNDAPKRSQSSHTRFATRPSWEKKLTWNRDKIKAKENGTTESWLRQCIDSPHFEISMGIVVVLHMLVMCSHLQWKANEIDKSFDRPKELEDPIGYRVIDKVFNAVYLMELCVRLRAFGWGGHFRQSPIINTADTLVIVVCCIVAFLLDPLQLDFNGDMIALARVIRMGRICRVLRAFKIFRFLSLFTELRIIIDSLQNAFSRTLLWAGVIVGFMVFVASLLITSVCFPYIEDPEMSVSQRRWIHSYCGTPARSIYTMFESTFTGRWGIPAKTLIFDISPLFSIFFVCYVLGVTFATMKVIGTIFLKQTMDQAHVDNERKAVQKLKEKEKRSNELRELYRLADTDGDGTCGQAELGAMMEIPRTLEILDHLEISPDEMWALIAMLTDEEVSVDFEEFLQCALKLKSSAQVVDVIQILHAQQIGMRRLDEITKLLRAGSGAITQVHVQVPNPALKQTVADARSPRTPCPRTPRKENQEKWQPS